MFISLINRDEDLAKYLKDNGTLKKLKNLHNLSSKVQYYLENSPLLKNMELCRPISGIKKLINDEKNRKESPDSTLNEDTVEKDFDISKIILTTTNNNRNKINSSKTKTSLKNAINNKNESPKKNEDSHSKEFPNIMLKENNIYNLNLSKKETLIPINENIEIIAEEDNNEFLLTGMKFNNSSKMPNNSFYLNIENDNNTNNDISNKKKIYKNIILPPLLKKSSSILSQNLRNTVLLIDNQNGTKITPIQGT
jgi:hypothetical protein